MTSDYERLRAALQAEIDEPGALTKDEARQVIASTVPLSASDEFDDTDFSPDFG